MLLNKLKACQMFRGEGNIGPKKPRAIPCPSPGLLFTLLETILCPPGIPLIVHAYCHMSPASIIMFFFFFFLREASSKALDSLCLNWKLKCTPISSFSIDDNYKDNFLQY